MIEAYPLHWPVGYPRTNRPLSSRFKGKSLAWCTGMVQSEVKRLNGRQLIISTNVPLRNDGLPRSDYQRRIIIDKGVAVYFIYKDKQVVLACDKWDTIEDNLYAITLSIEAMRGLDRWGVSEIMERTFTGFTALPEPEVNGKKTCWEVLEMQPTKNADALYDQYRTLSKLRHPDTGGTKEDFIELRAAYEEAEQYCKS